MYPGTPVAPGDLAGQVAQALRNTAIGLEGAGASFADVLRLTFYVTRWSPEKIGHLFEPDVLVEVEATALLGLIFWRGASVRPDTVA